MKEVIKYVCGVFKTNPDTGIFVLKGFKTNTLTSQAIWGSLITENDAVYKSCPWGTKLNW